MVDKDILSKVRRVHFIGVGGSGMCPMAEILFHKGYIVSGSDNYESDTFKRIKDLGMDVVIGHEAKNVFNAELVVYSAAVKSDNVELIAAKEQGIPCIERSVMLGLITDRYANSIAVAGTHGKTTTTAMLTQIMIEGKKDPTSIIGGKLPFLQGNSCIGKSENIICEACEYVDTFLQLNPAIAVITNLEADHLDYFKTLDNVIASFRKFSEKTSKVLIVNGDDENIKKAICSVKIPVITFGMGEHNDFRAEHVKLNSDNTQNFVFTKSGEKIADVKLVVPGGHNVMNALAAATVAYYNDVNVSDIVNALEKFTGVHRRFELITKVNGITVVDDFAHHPTELTTTLNAAKNMNFKRVIAVFQPHTYSRTYMFLDDFAKALSIADKVVLSQILAVRETNTYNIYSSDLAKKIDNCVCFDTFDEISDYIASEAKEGDLIITLGGGNVYVCAAQIAKKLSGE